MKNINEFRKEGKHLPEFLKDFHDQKDFFKAMQDTYSERLEKEMPNYNWIQNHIFCIDFFLWFLAWHGYSIQKMKHKNVDFKDLAETITENRRERADHFSKIIQEPIT